MSKKCVKKKERIKKRSIKINQNENPIHTLYDFSKKINKNENNFSKTEKEISCLLNNEEKTNYDKSSNLNNISKKDKLVKDSKWTTTYKTCFLETAKQITNSNINSQKLETFKNSNKKKEFLGYSKKYQNKKKKLFNTYGKNFKNTIFYTRDELLNDPDAELLRGTTKLTNHVPGYSGHIPYNSHNKKIRDQIFNSKNRSFLSKENILENFSKHIPGYSGYEKKNF